MAETKFDICSRALVRIGAKPITSFDDNTTESDVAREEYEPLVQAMLSAYPWRFAGRQFRLNKLAERPLDRWAWYYQLPSDLLVLRAVTWGGLPIEYDRYEDRIATNHDGDIVADYTIRPDESRWPPFFTHALTLELESIFARAIARDSDLADRKKKEAESAWAKARNLDSQQQTARRFQPSRLVTVRF